MNFFKWLFSEPKLETDIQPGEIRVERNWTDNPETDTTVITIGGQITSKQKRDIEAVLAGRATAHRKPKRMLKEEAA